MTREEILNMPASRKMDILIAEKVFGVTWLMEQKSYSTDIAAAFELTKKAAYFELRLGDINLGYKKWYCEFATEKSHAWGAEADTAPLAMSRAVLLTTMDKNDTYEFGL